MGGRQEIAVYQLDVFADQPFAGNPACVCLLPWNTVLSEAYMLKIAAEMGCTAAFLSMISDNDSFATASRFNLRWFTPKMEIKLCGHATVATGAVLTRYYNNQNDDITFLTSGGDLIVRKDGDKICMDLPVGVSNTQKKEDYVGIIKSFGDLPGVEEVHYCSTLNYLLICLKPEWTRKQFEQWTPDIPTVHKAGDNGVLKAVIVTMRADADSAFKDTRGVPYDFASRVFGPWLGAPEDPVTGSAHTILPYYWSTKLGKMNFFVRQCSPRGGDLDLQLKGDRVELKGKVVKILQGTLTI